MRIVYKTHRTVFTPLLCALHACRCNDGTTPFSNEGPFGGELNWSKYQECPAGQFICGLKVGGRESSVTVALTLQAKRPAAAAQTCSLDEPALTCLAASSTPKAATLLASSLRFPRRACTLTLEENRAGFRPAANICGCSFGCGSA